MSPPFFLTSLIALCRSLDRSTDSPFAVSFPSVSGHLFRGQLPGIDHVRMTALAKQAGPHLLLGARARPRHHEGLLSKLQHLTQRVVARHGDDYVGGIQVVNMHQILLECSITVNPDNHAKTHPGFMLTQMAKPSRKNKRNKSIAFVNVIWMFRSHRRSPEETRWLKMLRVLNEFQGRL